MASLKSRLQHSIAPVALRSYLAEFISTFIYVFAAVGAAVSSRKNGGSDSSSSIEAMAKAFALTVGVFISANISGGHLNPAVTFGMAIGGHITLVMALLYWISQMLASLLACLVIKTMTVSQHVPIHTVPNEMTGFGAAILEGLMTFALVYTVFASSDPRRGVGAALGPLAVGLVVGANVLAMAPFTGASMNPAYSFGAALVGGTFRNQAVYWVGPFIGAALAAILYDNLLFPVAADSVSGGVVGV
ncbi:hypothetical protein ACS0TY_010978 [Phlomoides rotata]